MEFLKIKFVWALKFLVSFVVAVGVIVLPALIFLYLKTELGPEGFWQKSIFFVGVGFAWLCVQCLCVALGYEGLELLWSRKEKGK